MIDTIEVTTTDRGDLPLVDARAIVAILGPQLLAYLRGTVEDSEDPATGAPKKALSPRSAKLPRKGGRGYATGELAEGLSLEVTGRGSVAAVIVRAPVSRHVFTLRERGRGVTYLTIDGLVGKLVDRVIDEELRG